LAWTWGQRLASQGARGQLSKLCFSADFFTLINAYTGINGQLRSRLRSRRFLWTIKSLSVISAMRKTTGVSDASFRPWKMEMTESYEKTARCFVLKMWNHPRNMFSVCGSSFFPR
jgi:hypothetical protein